LFNLIPFLGFYLAIIPAMIIGLATGGPIMLLKVLIVYIIEQTLEGRFVSPLVLGKQLSIHPITVLFVLLTAGKVFGLWGVLLGIPFYAAAKVIITHIYDWYREISELYQPVDLDNTSELEKIEES
ncbi:MAG: AI-2E family transporter, partial [Lactococcus sp.]